MITKLTALLVFLSLCLIIIVPVALGTPAEWEKSRRNVYRAIQVWVFIVLIIAARDGAETSGLI